jgi:hypothetical protein
MLACLDICFEAIEVNQQIDLHRLPPWQVGICDPSRIPVSYWSPDPDPDPLSLWLVAPVTSANGSELHLQRLPEPLFQTDLQTALLRCLVKQGQAAAPASDVSVERAQEALE